MMDYKSAYEMMTQRANETYNQLIDTLQKLWKLEEQLGLPKTTYDDD